MKKALKACVGLLLLVAGCRNELTATVQFDKMGDLLPGATVTYKGTTVGQVRSVELNREGKFDVLLAIGQGFAQGIKEDSSFKVVSKDEIQVTPGSEQSPPLKPGAVIQGDGAAAKGEPKTAEAGGMSADPYFQEGATPKPMRPPGAQKKMLASMKNQGLVPANLIRWKFSRLMERASAISTLEADKVEAERQAILKELDTIVPKLPEYGLGDDPSLKSLATAIRAKLASK